VDVARPVTPAHLIAEPAATVPVRWSQPAARIERLRLIQPELAALVSGLRIPTAGLPRDRITVPISPAAEVTDQVLFEEPGDPTKKRYLPRYRLAEQQVSGQRQYRIALEVNPPGGWGLAVHLEKYPAPEIEAASRSARELDHQVAVFLRYRMTLGGSGVAQKELSFQEVTAQEGGLRAVLHVATLGERDQLVNAITSAEAAAALVVRRAVQVAIPVPRAEGPTLPPEARAGERPREPRPDPRADSLTLRPQPPAAPERLVARSTVASPVFADDTARPEALSAIRLVRPIRLPSPDVDSEVPLYRQVTRALDHTAEPSPFFFVPALHGYIFRSVALPPPGSPGLVRHQLQWHEGFQSYYQDAARPHLFYYLPDSFKLVRRPETPHNPIMAIRIAATDGSLEKVQVTLEFVAAPFVDRDRLDDAAKRLKRLLPDPLPHGIEGPEFQPLLAETRRFRLALPRADASSGIWEDRDKALVDLRAGIHDSVTLPMAAFQSVYDALHGSGSALLFQGEVEVDLEPAPNERLPFTARMNDLIGELFDYREVPDEASGGVAATLRNAIESPVRIRRLDVSLRRGASEVPARIEGTSFDPPVELRPGQELAFRVVPEAPLAGTGPVDAVFDLDGVEVLPDREAVWNAVLDPSTPAEYARTVRVKTFRQIFDAPPERPNDQVLAIVADFERGGTVDLTADKLEADAELRMPISDYVLRRVDEREYRYKVTVIRRAGRSADQEWRKDRTGILYPEVN
jgi:hypothetical protein